MCGIAGIILKDRSHPDLSGTILRMSRAIAHRGPDGEGFISFSNGTTSTHAHHDFKAKETSFHYSPKLPVEAINGARLTFAHRRLSILDLSAAGHQPMCDVSGKIWITFNGEIYNYLELREELAALGHHFVSGTDTEVILCAFKSWGPECVNRFNGMWAFCIFDETTGKCFASRDRLGVKPFYYVNNPKLLAFASEQKAFTRSDLIKASADEMALQRYLISGQLENSTDNFFEGVHELWPGHSLTYDINTTQLIISSWFQLNSIKSLKNDSLPDDELIRLIRHSLDNNIKMRLRSDVEVGTCLSGGIDSSIIAMLMSSQQSAPVHCFTSVFPGSAINEEEYAGEVVKQAGGIHHKSAPTYDDFLRDADDLIYSQDVPIWDTSTYAQHRVMALAKENGIKVVLDGQGADELFAGYHHHFIAKWNRYLSEGRTGKLLSDLSAASRSIPSPYLFYVKQLIKPYLTDAAYVSQSLLTREFAERFPVRKVGRFNDVNDQLMDDITNTRLKIFLKCEDRCGMWHGVESRTPFSDDPALLELMFSFRGERKIQNGTLKYLLREAARDVLPPMIYARHDKKGFDTPMQEWIRNLFPQMVKEIKAAELTFVYPQKIERATAHDFQQNKLLFRLFVFARWKRLFGAS
jgi:asparagine synthase (glutamine-hydrolysing)